ncbi:MAG: hypothetical protein K8R16_05070 [Anaerolineales bacterium]|nr:hypothetical protein [Anaerolineales bacterium]
MDENAPIYITSSFDKIERSVIVSREIFDICLLHAKEDDPRLLEKAGVLLGDFVNNLRSALNYTTRAIILREVFPKLTPKEQKKLERKLDFPWSSSEEDFLDKPLIKHLMKVEKPLFDLLHKIQPFNPDNEWLKHLMDFSNKDKHVIANEVRSAIPGNILGINPDGTTINEPWFVDDKLLVFTDQEPIWFELPLYFEPLKSFASTSGNWIIYLIPLNELSSLGLIDYTIDTPRKVVNILAAMDSIYK